MTADTTVMNDPSARRSSVIRINGGATHPSELAAHTPAQSLAVQRSRIQRSIRLQFIYPLTYIILWIVPFTLHCLQYQERFAQSPPFPLSIIVVICLTSMGTVDCIIFGLRERPWRHMPQVNPTFRGSFVCWGAGSSLMRHFRHGSRDFDDESRRSSTNTGTNPDPDSVLNSRSNTTTSNIPTRTFSGYSLSFTSLTTRRTDKQKGTADLAYQRLQIEKEDRRQAILMRDLTEEKAAAEPMAAEDKIKMQKRMERGESSGSGYSQRSGKDKINLTQSAGQLVSETGEADRIKERSETA